MAALHNPSISDRSNRWSMPASRRGDSKQISHSEFDGPPACLNETVTAAGPSSSREHCTTPEPPRSQVETRSDRTTSAHLLSPPSPFARLRTKSTASSSSSPRGVGVYVDPAEPLVQVGWIAEGDLVAVIANDMSCEPTLGVLVGLTSSEVAIRVVNPSQRSLDFSAISPSPSSNSAEYIKQTVSDERVVLQFSRGEYIIRRAREVGLVRSRSSWPVQTHL